MGLKPHSRHLPFFTAGHFKDDCRRLVIHRHSGRSTRRASCRTKAVVGNCCCPAARIAIGGKAVPRTPFLLRTSMSDNMVVERRENATQE